MNGERQAKPATFIPYGKQLIDNRDIDAVVEVLQSEWLTTGPKVEEFEKAVAGFSGASYGVAVSSGTAGLHAAMGSLGVGPGDEVIVPAITFVATANCVVYQGAKPVFADVEEGTLLIDPEKIVDLITPATKGIIAVDYAGQPCDYDRLLEIAERHNLFLVADSCHALGAGYKDKPAGSLADITIFSFHPVKHITTGEGGMAVTNRQDLADKLRIFRNHGITSDHRQRERKGTFAYEMTTLGFNYRMSDIQCALGLSQLQKLPEWLAKRQEIAQHYSREFMKIADVQPLSISEDVVHAWHLYVVKLSDKEMRSRVFQEMRQNKIGVNVHYLPVYLHPYYKEKFGYAAGYCPVAEKVYDQIISLPMYPGLSAEDIKRVVDVAGRCDGD